MRVVLDVYSDAGHLHGQLRTTEHAAPVAFFGVLDLVSALEQLEPQAAPGDDAASRTLTPDATTEVTP
jgi:hypothetical protein